jgi:sigma-B regulation protein RsbU (phosphoserine phosphatase)
MFSTVPERAKSSLRFRLLVATLVLVALALTVAAVAFERVARSVIVDAIHSHLSARAEEVQAAVVRFQRERALAVRSWAEAEAMQMTIDSGDPKFAEDYLRRTIQDQGGTISAAALLDMDGAIIAAVREGAEGERRGVPVVSLRGVVLGDAAVKAALDATTELGDGVAAGVAPLSRLDPTEARELGVMVAAPVKDFAADLVGVVVAIMPPQALSRLLGGIAADGNYQPVLADEGLTLVLSVPGASPQQARALAEAAAGPPGALQHVALAGAEPVLSVRTATGVGVPGWRTLMTVHEGDAYGRLYWLRALLGVMFVIVLAAAGLASVGAIRQASRPLTDITRSMSAVAGGDLSTRVPEAYRDELGDLVHSFNVMVSEVERSRDELQRTEALRREVEIAHRIQTAILPVAPSLAGYDVAARMKPADDVGGDLYDLLPFEDTFWVLVGDVSGHGINSGLVMMMAQAAAYAAIAENPRLSPKSVIAAVNRVVHENVRKRMRRDDYLTLMAARHLGDGRFVAAGAHQPIFLSRGGGKVEVIEPAGPWCGLGPHVQPREYEFEVRPGEMLCLITDGVVEAPDARGDLFGEDRLAQMLSEPAVHTASASQALAAIFSRVEAFAATQADDMTAVVLRRQPHA